MAFNLFGKKSYVGLDLGHHTIKAVQVEKSGGGWKVTRLGSIPTPEESIRESVVVDPQAVAVAIKQLLRENHITANSAHIAVAGGSVIVRNVRVPRMPEATLRKSIKFEAGRYVPSSTEDSFIEFEIIGDVDESQMDVLVVAAPKDVVASRVAACEAAGLEVDSVDIEPFAAYRSLVESEHNEELMAGTLVLVDIGASSTNLSVISQGVFAMTRSISQAGDSLTDALKKNFNLSDEDAEAGKAQLDLNELVEESAFRENPPLKVIQPHLDDLIREIRRSLNYYQSQQPEGSPSRDVNKVLISGGGSRMSGLAKYLSKKLEIDTEAADVLQKPTFLVTDPTAETKPIDIAVASGLAMRMWAKAA